MKLALHRSLIFWAGILVMGFIGWAWWDSYRGAGLVVGQRCLAANALGGLLIGHSESFPTKWAVDREPLTPVSGLVPQALPLPGWARGQDARSNTHFDSFGRPPSFPKMSVDEWLEEMMRSNPPGDWRLFIPHWLILAVVAGVWMGLLVWRARRRRGRVNIEE